mmetsp:Transcript_56139/g.149825  ORF Transcript_56139/g.149825 Transcript_56139/m.149825 type:complete len:158 (-) Transcript_56139:73-546(-)
MLRVSGQCPALRGRSVLWRASSWRCASTGPEPVKAGIAELRRHVTRTRAEFRGTLASGPEVTWYTGSVLETGRLNGRSEHPAEKDIFRASRGSPMARFPVYDTPRFVAGNFTGTNVVGPAPLRHAVESAILAMPRAKCDGCVLKEGDDPFRLELAEK